MGLAQKLSAFMKFMLTIALALYWIKKKHCRCGLGCQVIWLFPVAVLQQTIDNFTKF